MVLNHLLIMLEGLKDESTVLSKRMSAASVTSSEDQATGQYHAPPRPGTSTSSHSHTNSKPSAIPRPSIQSSRPTELSAGVYAGAAPPSFQRARALSQPFPFEPSLHADQTPPATETRSISPINAPKGTRIPVSRTRTGSTSSQAQSTYTGASTAGRVNGYARHNGECDIPPELSVVHIGEVTVNGDEFLPYPVATVRVALACVGLRTALIAEGWWFHRKGLHSRRDGVW